MLGWLLIQVLNGVRRLINFVDKINALTGGQVTNLGGWFRYAVVGQEELTVPRTNVVPHNVQIGMGTRR